MAPTLVAARRQSVDKYISNRDRHTRAESLHNSIDILGLNAVDDEVAASRHEMATLHDFNIGLAVSAWVHIHCIYGLSYKVLELFHQCFELVRKIAGMYPLQDY